MRLHYLVIVVNRLFSDIKIHKATYSRCGVIFNNDFTANLPSIPTVKKFRNSV